MGVASLKRMKLIQIGAGPSSDMEKLLLTWIDSQLNRYVSPQHQDEHRWRKMFVYDVYNAQFTSRFKWLNKFKNHFSLH